MILIAVGSNLPVPGFGTPAQICNKALARLDSMGIRVVGTSRLYQTAPVPLSDQPWFVNAVAAVDTGLQAAALLASLHQVEQEFGRVRRERNEARVLDLDLIDYKGVVSAGMPILPHPRLAERAFVLLPLRDVCPQWRHPVTGVGIDDLIASLPPDQAIRPLSGLE
ncbi:2-amino-4-hydroxy-6-hydroxymethyldihydropteridine diphosphokinase [Niveispirillum lacus]|uniref:2-amino-4-hydroxy-6-hydroxymethyldihydropteridine pyrophosphokinase n=1 Tax=Niveispirillum lacus TaxID=1981099 RepID=A0A255YU40_9PROT|nr:2-amino-4-hydroxy-6-hydroxymethyldihydropteridine diphosphokinase [Niveispirillum lacus]OYQ32699.1 2-amino-4-hydroxy-6-hydroxymethyldihydropteridine diphosphokinase [Niveispirillum lacus]